MSDETKELRRLMRLADDYAHERGIGNEMDNEHAIARARDALLKALKDFLAVGGRQ